MPPQVVENLLWFYTEPGDIVFDPFAGGGTTIDVAKRMGRRVWSSDRKPSTPTLPIHQHDITTGWPDGAPPTRGSCTGMCPSPSWHAGVRGPPPPTAHPTRKAPESAVQPPNGPALVHRGWGRSVSRARARADI